MYAYSAKAPTSTDQVSQQLWPEHPDFYLQALSKVVLRHTHPVRCIYPTLVLLQDTNPNYIHQMAPRMIFQGFLRTFVEQHNYHPEERRSVALYPVYRAVQVH